MERRDTLALLRGEFFLRSDEGQRFLMRNPKLKKLLDREIHAEGKVLKPKLFLDSSSVSILLKGKGRFYRLPDSISHDLEGKFFQLPDISIMRADPKGSETEGVQIKDPLLPDVPLSRRENTMIVRVRLDRQKGDIERGFKNVLDVLDLTAKRKLLFHRPRPHLDELKAALKVYDLRQEQIKQGKTSWRKLAAKVFQGEDIEDATRKVRRYCDTAKKMINGGWKQLL